MTRDIHNTAFISGVSRFGQTVTSPITIHVIDVGISRSIYIVYTRIAHLRGLGKRGDGRQRTQQGQHR